MEERGLILGLLGTGETAVLGHRRPTVSWEEETQRGNSGALKALAITIFVSGIRDAIGALIYLVLFARGTGGPPTHPFHALFIASFLVCFGYLLIMSAFNIRRCLLILGAVIIGGCGTLCNYFPSCFSWRTSPAPCR